MNGQLTVEELILMLREKVADGAIKNTDTVMWKHREWGHVAVTDIIKVDADAEGDAGLIGCCALVPAKFVPKERAEGCFDLSIDFIPADKKIAAIKALREIIPGLGLREAKEGVESIPGTHYNPTSGHMTPLHGSPFKVPSISPSRIVSIKALLSSITGVWFTVTAVGDVGDLYIEDTADISSAPF